LKKKWDRCIAVLTKVISLMRNVNIWLHRNIVFRKTTTLTSTSKLSLELNHLIYGAFSKSVCLIHFQPSRWKQNSQFHRQQRIWFIVQIDMSHTKVQRCYISHLSFCFSNWWGPVSEYKKKKTYGFGPKK
jgi:hypothetical protein